MLARALALVTPAALMAAPPAYAQEFDRGRVPANVRLEVLYQPYRIGGTTARDIRQQLDALAPTAGILDFSLFYSWRYESERVMLARGTPSTNCRLDDMTVLLDVRLGHPQWTPPDDAPEDLLNAWEAFANVIDQTWEWRRERVFAKAREAIQRVRRIEENCASLGDRVGFLVRQAFDSDPPEWLDNAPPRPALRWPPAGYEYLMRDAPPPSSTSDAAPRTPAPSDSAPSTAAAVASPGASVPPDDASVPPPAPRAQPRPSLIEAVGRDLEGRGPSGASLGFALGVLHDGEVQFLSGFGTPNPAVPDPMGAEDTFVFPAFTEVLIATLAAALDRTGVLDLDAPLGTALAGLDERLGTATLEQLLSHTAGLDNAMPRDTTLTWEAVLEQLDDGALFTDPGVLYSESRYSYGLALRAIEAVSGLSFEDAAAQILLEPLGMESTSFGSREADEVVDGLPVTHTSAPDLVRFWSAWWGGSIPGSGPMVEPAGGYGRPAGGLQTFHRGFWVDEVAGQQRLMLMCSALGVTSGFQVFPERRTLVVFGGTGALPLNALTFVMNVVGGVLDLGIDVFGPGWLEGGGSVGLPERRCRPQTLTRARRPRDFGPFVEAADWPGRYLNGDRLFELGERDGRLVALRQGLEPYDVQHFGGTTHFVSLDLPPRAGFPVELRRDDLGRRYIVIGDRAYIHEDDRPAP